MFVKDKYSDESYIHVCDGKTKRQMAKKAIEVRLHDITIFVIARDENNTPKLEHIKYCPYCGADLEKDSNDESRFDNS